MRTTDIPDGKPVFIYWNLHRNCYSVRSRSGDDRGRVIAHVDRFTLNNVSFRVSKAGRDRVLAEQKKNVHAGLAGTWANEPTTGGATQITYNPYIAGHFRIKHNDRAIRRADEANGRIVDDKAVILV